MQRPSLRLTPITTKEQQSAVDRAEQQQIEAIFRWRYHWLGVFVEIISIAHAAQRRDLDEVCRHANHLQGALMRLRTDALEKENGHEPLPLAAVMEGSTSAHRRSG